MVEEPLGGLSRAQGHRPDVDDGVDVDRRYRGLAPVLGLEESHHQAADEDSWRLAEEVTDLVQCHPQPLLDAISSIGVSSTGENVGARPVSCLKCGQESVSDLSGSWLVVFQQIERDSHRRCDRRQWFWKDLGRDGSERNQAFWVSAESEGQW